MQTTLLGWTRMGAWGPAPAWPASADLVLYFGAAAVLDLADGPLAELHRRFPQAVVAGCSTAGEILGAVARDESLAVVIVEFGHSRVRASSLSISDPHESLRAATYLGRNLAAPDLRHVFVLSDGLLVNGTALANGFRSVLPANVAVTGGLAGDGSSFRRTLVGLGGELGPGRIVAIGFYGSQLEVSHGLAGGWTAFGPRRLVTRSEGNVLHTLDGQPALALYKRYLGDRAESLPASGLLFPLNLLADREDQTGLVRTLLAVDEASQTLTFAGDLPQGAYVRLMKATCDDLAGAAEVAAGHASARLTTTDGSFSILVSCVGRKLVMGQRVEEELEGALDHLGPTVHAAGFYSYGELSPTGRTGGCELHNQTMTMTVFSERV